MTAPKILSLLKILLSSTMLTLLLPSIVLITKLHPAQSHPISQIIQDFSSTQLSSISSRVLRYSYHGSQSEIKSQTLEEAAEKALNELYHPATFDCDCDDAFETKRGRASPTIYDVSCISLKSVCHNRVCAVVKWDALFNSSLQPREERVCVSIHAGSGTCPELSGRDFCFEFDYEGSNVSRCRAAVGTEECRSCEMCGVSEGTNGGGGMQFLAPDCSNVEGMESKKFTCEDIQTVDDFNNIAFQCPRKKEEKKIKSTDPTAATTTTTKATVSPQKVKTVGRKPSSASKSSKSSSSKSTKTSKSAKSGSKRG